MKITIIIPAYNEEKTIEEVISKVKNLKINKEIIVIDDGSKDNTWNKIIKISGIKIFRHDKNMGKGASVRTGINNSTGDIIIIQDADLELNPMQIPSIIKPILKHGADVVYGSRNNPYNDHHDRSPIFYFGGLIVTFLANFLYNIKITDEACGYKAFKKEVLKNIKIKSNRFEWEPEITAKIAKKNIKIKEVPIKSSARSKNNGKKLTRLDGLKAIWALIKYKFKD
jgi:glycosyltransferase involved in cell wall biosynthesis